MPAIRDGSTEEVIGVTEEVIGGATEEVIGGELVDAVVDGGTGLAAVEWIAVVLVAEEVVETGADRLVVGTAITASGSRCPCPVTVAAHPPAANAIAVATATAVTSRTLVVVQRIIEAPVPAGRNLMLPGGAPPGRGIRAIRSRNAPLGIQDSRRRLGARAMTPTCDDGRVRDWYIAGVLGTVLSFVACLAVQVISADPLPPDISISQYGVGSNGWVFSLWMLAFAAGACCLYRYRPVPGLGAGWWLLIGAIGTCTMALVRTDPGGLQHSVHASVHMVGSVLGLSGIPIGIMLMMLPAAALWRRLAVALVAVSAVSLFLLLLSAAGADTTGYGASTSWAFWQSLASSADMLMLALQCLAVSTLPPLAGDPEPWWIRHPAAGSVRGGLLQPTHVTHGRFADSA